MGQQTKIYRLGESRAASFISYRDEAAPDNKAITEIIASKDDRPSHARLRHYPRLSCGTPTTR